MTIKTLFLSLFFALLLSPASLFALEAEDATRTIDHASLQSSEAAQTEEKVIQEVIEEDLESSDAAITDDVEIVKEIAPAIPQGVETLPEHHPTVYITPLGGELNLKVSYDHPMDMEGGDHLESIQMETLDETFLGVKQFNSRAKQASAEFLVNPALADFNQVVLVAKSTKYGVIKSVHNLILTPVEDLPDELNPARKRERDIAALHAKNEKLKEGGEKAALKAKEEAEKLAEKARLAKEQAAAKARETQEKTLENAEIKSESAHQEAAVPVPAEESKKKKKWGLF